MRANWPKSQENHRSLFPKVPFLVAKFRYYVIITFQMLKMEFKFEYKALAKKVHST